MTSDSVCVLSHKKHDVRFCLRSVTKQHDIMSINGEDVRLDLWDASGSQEFFDLRQSYYEGVDAVLLVFDASAIQSFEHLDTWAREAISCTRNSPCKIFVCSTQADRQDLAISLRETNEWAHDRGFECFEASAKNDGSVKDMFDKIVHSICGVAPRPGSSDHDP
eukprot:GEMP01119426.1.p1 GENE.GEMP01119426.1~~GEMP01119426.1.p1  ORF type:complete len:180 (+),score=36.34 GEMP01119426.1:51-542(+)